MALRPRRGRVGSGSVGEGLRARPRGSRGGRVAELLRSAFTLFGADRLLFGSDWPMSTRTTTYAEVLAATRRALPPWPLPRLERSGPALPTASPLHGLALPVADPHRVAGILITRATPVRNCDPAQGLPTPGHFRTPSRIRTGSQGLRPAVRPRCETANSRGVSRGGCRRRGRGTGGRGLFVTGVQRVEQALVPVRDLVPVPVKVGSPSTCMTRRLGSRRSHMRGGTRCRWPRSPHGGR